MAGFSTVLVNFVLCFFSMEGQPTMGALRFTFSMIFIIVLANHDAVADSGRLDFICHPETNDVHKEQCFSQYSAEMNPLMRLYHFLLVTALILFGLWIAMIRYSSIHLRKIRRVTDSSEREHLWHEFRQIFLLHVSSEAVVLSAMLGLFCFVQKIHFAETYVCALKIAPVITCKDLHHQVKYIFNILFIEGLAFLLFLCIVTVCQAVCNKESFIKELLVLNARENKAVTPVRHMTWNFGVAQVPNVIHQDLKNYISLDWKIMSNESRERVGEEATTEVLGEALKEIKRKDLSVKVNTSFTTGVNYLLGSFQPEDQPFISGVRLLLSLIMFLVSARLYTTMDNERLDVIYYPETVYSFMGTIVSRIVTTGVIFVWCSALSHYSSKHHRKIRKKTVCSKKEHLCYKFWKKYPLDVCFEAAVIALSLALFLYTCLLKNTSVEIVLTRRDVHHWEKENLNIVIIGGMTLSWLLCMWTICYAICKKKEFIKNLVDLTTGKQKRKRWTREENVVVMECYYKSKLYGDSEYMPTMRDLWIERGMPDLPKDRLRRQAHTILKNDLLHEHELKQIRDRVGFQEGKGREKRKRWTHEENVVVMECYYKSKLSGDYGYMKRMRELWIREGRFDITKERLAGQARSILKKYLLPEDELKEIRRKSNIVRGTMSDKSLLWEI